MNLNFSLIRSEISPPLRPPRRFGKYIRFKICNTGRKPAEYCEAKIEPMNQNMESIPGIDPSILHWVRRYPRLYRNPDELYAPITINVNDYELLDGLEIEGTENTGNTLTDITVQTYSHRPFHVQPETTYFFKVTVFSRNAKPISKTIRLYWDGTWEGFNEESVSLVS